MKTFLTLSLFFITNSMQSTSSFTPSRPAEETIEKLSRWKKRWDDNFIGWHKVEPHRNLLKHGNQIIPSFIDNEKSCQSQTTETTKTTQDFRVFLPLCGKSVDMAFLALQPSVTQVVGIDGIRKALVAFADENPSLEIQTNNAVDENDVVERMTGKGIDLLRGDFFDLNDGVTNGKFDMILDRASIVAIQPNLREKYVDVLGKLIRPGGKILLMTVDRRSGKEEARKAGPPFSVDEEEVRRLYENLDWVENVKLVDEYDEFQDPGMKDKFGSQGLDSVFELCFIITTKN